ncbi:MAG: hypothetical protein ABL986_02695 [Vicinamibacterales bacterium]
MFNGFAIFFGIAFVCAIVVILDRWGRRRERRSRERPASGA